jgi:hypothetical protein
MRAVARGAERRARTLSAFWQHVPIRGVVNAKDKISGRVVPVVVDGRIGEDELVVAPRIGVTGARCIGDLNSQHRVVRQDAQCVAELANSPSLNIVPVAAVVVFDRHLATLLRHHVRP